MLITRIELENIKSYRKVEIDLRRGATAISGANGAGKTTLVEAIGFALFGYLPYSQEQFVREGEKFGRVVIHLIGGDDRPYSVERRCGSGARWFVYDEEANLRLEQRADVLDRLHDLFGIDRERPLDALFRDALGVPQGTFTAIFLDPPAKRKQTFDALLQIEDYKTAADNLLETQKHYREQKMLKQFHIEHLTTLTQGLEEWREQLRMARQLDEVQKHQNESWNQQLQDLEAREIVLQKQLERLNLLTHQLDGSRNVYANAQRFLQERGQQLEDARKAYQQVEDSRNDRQRYLQAQDTLEQLRQQAQERDALRLQQAEHQKLLAGSEIRISGLQERLHEVAVAQARLLELSPLVEQQIALEQKRDEAMQRLSRYDTIMEEGKRLRKQFDDTRQKQVACQQSINDIEPLLPVAERLSELTEKRTQLQIQARERSTLQRQWQEKQDTLRERKLSRDRDTDRLRQVEQEIADVEAHRSEAEEFPQLKEQQQRLSEQMNRLEGNIEGYVRWRSESAGGQCPLLHEGCLNIKQKGMASLESYFDRLLADEHAELARMRQQQEQLATRVGQVQKFADAFAQLGILLERGTTLSEQLQRSALDITRQERDVAMLAQDLDALKTLDRQQREVEAAFQESKQADTQVRELAGLYKQLQQFQEQLQQHDARLQDLRREITQFSGSEDELKKYKEQLTTLDDPRAQNQAQQHITANEDQYQQKLKREQRRQQDVLGEIEQLNQQLQVYAELDSAIVGQEAIIKSCHPGYQRYLHNEQEALQLPRREKAYQEQQQQTEQAARELEHMEQAHQQAQATFNQEEFRTIQERINTLRRDLLQLSGEMQRHQEDINRLEAQIAEAEGRRRELDAARLEHLELEELQAMTEQFRKLMKEAAPRVLKAMLADISAEANRIFGEIMGDRSAQLSWRNDYEIILRRGGVDRSFAQLSGGEQMSAALSVRLALLKKLSTLNLAFFDEPTQNMDELRRMNLAEQIRRVRGFDQLIVISHDDTFEQGLDSLIRLQKIHGETQQVIDEDGDVPQVELSFMHNRTPIG